jgi:hypothetical protein
VTALLLALGVAVVVLALLSLHLTRRARAAARKAGTRAESGSPAGGPAEVPKIPRPRNPAVPPASAWAKEEVPPPTANVAVVTRYEIWMRRVEQEKLGARSDIWADLSDAPQYAEWKQLAEERAVHPGQHNGHPGGGVNGSQDAEVQHYIARGLLAEVLYAAGGVERELRELRRALKDGQRPASPGAPPEPTSARALVAARPVRDASYSFVNLLSWARLTVDRTDRPYRPGLSRRTGLLPALQPGELHDSVEAAIQHLRSTLLDSRALAGYAFHTAAIPGEGTPATPLTLSEERDMLTYATDLMTAMEVFVNQVLDAFAASQSVASQSVASSPSDRRRTG